MSIRTKRNSGLLRITSFLIIATLLLGVWPFSAVTASAMDAEASSPPAVMSEEDKPDTAVEGEAPIEGEAPAEGEAPDGGEIPDEGENPEMEGDPATPTDVPGIYENSISGALWLDVFDDPDSGVHSGDGIRQAEEEALSGYALSLYSADDRANPIQTVSTNGSGEYRFENIDPGSYVVGVSSATVGGVEYLLPIEGITGDNQFSDFSDDYTTIYSAPIEVEEDTVATGINAGMRTPPEIMPLVDDAVGAQKSGGMYFDGIGPLTSTMTMTLGNGTTQTHNSITVSINFSVSQNTSALYGRPYYMDLSTTSNFSTFTQEYLGGLSSNATYTKTFSGLTANTTYYVRFRCVSDNKDMVWGSPTGMYFALSTSQAPPYFSVGTATVNAATITNTSATATASVNTNGQGGYGLWAWSELGNDSWTAIGGSFFPLEASATSATSSLSGLPAGTRIKVMLYVMQAGVGWIEGTPSEPFTTIGEPIKSQLVVSGVTADAATLSLDFDANPGSSTNPNCYIHDHEIFYRIKGTSSWISAGALMGNSVTTKISGTGTGTLTGLAPNTTYEVYAVIANGYIQNSDLLLAEFTTGTPGQTVTVKHVDKDGNVLAGAAGGDPYMVTAGASFTVPTETVAGYIPVYYKVGGITYDLATTQTIAADTTVTVYYASTILDISYPLSGMAFTALHTGNGAVTSANYEFENLSDLPVQVSFKEMQVINNAGVNFVSNATNRNEIHLSLLASSGNNGFASNLSNITPDTPYGSPPSFGTLDGVLVGNVGNTKGFLHIGGHYEGPFPLTPKQPQVEFTFHFLLVE
ncbi:MAG: SdrD B-like domain-containing protein [Oscillibacter sp.]|nr:SdrD B-like domain-containing protein [Oscillibacter sp.]MEA4992476.1 SdrD B-like domain-containing protein [Oscillibacter sp.]